jgi:CubicO group peptidase (beta-lactamase class C family)
MLQHTSGIGRSIIPDQYPGQLRDRDIFKLHLRLDTPEYEPGTKMQYSNDAYVLLGTIVERLSGLSFSNFMEREIFKKIGMENSVLHDEGITEVNNRAYGYTKFLDGFGFCDQSQTSLVLGDGGVYSNLDDMYMWDQGLYSDVLVSKETIEQAFIPGTLLNGKKYRMATVGILMRVMVLK